MNEITPLVIDVKSYSMYILPLNEITLSVTGVKSYCIYNITPTE